MNLVQRQQSIQEVPALVLQGFVGLSLKLDFVNRPKQSFQQLDNFDLYVPGSIRKVLPAVKYGGPYGSDTGSLHEILYDCVEYLAQPNNPQGGTRRLIGFATDGRLYDLASLTPSVPYANTQYLDQNAPFISIPTMRQYAGFYIPYNVLSWRASTAYALHDAVVEYGPDGNIYIYEVTAAGTSAADEPIWPLSGSVSEVILPAFSMTLGATTADNTAVWTNKGKPAWIASHNYNLGDLVIDSNGNLQKVTTKTGAGQSSTVQPIWSAALNGTTGDGASFSNGVVWTCLLQPAWQAGHLYGLNALIIDQNGFIQEVTTGGTSGSAGTLVWTNRGMPNSTRFGANYIAVAMHGIQPFRVVEWQYDPTSGSETPSITTGQMGCSAPSLPPQLGGFITTPNLNGYAPSAGRAYQWTFYNPNTLQESSPSPFVGATKITEVDNSNAHVTINGSLLVPLPPTAKATEFTSYQIYYIATSVASLAPPIGSGYTCIRIYATKDGGTEFFLVNTLLDEDGIQLSNADGSVPIATLKTISTAQGYTDYFPLPTPQNAQPSIRLFEGSGPINFAPDPVNLGVPAWGPGLVNPGPIYVANNTAPDGANSFQIDGPNTGKSLFKSANIDVNPSEDFYFQMFLDKSNGTGGTMSAKVCSVTGTVLLTLTQADSTAGTLSGTFNTGTHGQIFIQIFVNEVTIGTDESLIWADPVLQMGTVFNPTVTNYPTTDDSLVTPAPIAFANNPPPIARSMLLFLDAMIYVDDQDASKYWWSQQGQPEKVGANSFDRTTIGTTIMELIRVLDRLVFVKERSMEQVTTYPPANPQALDPQHGGLSYRSGVPFGAALVALMTHGLGQLGLAQSITEAQQIVSTFEPTLVGDDIKPIVDDIASQTLYAQHIATIYPSPTVLNALNMFLLAYESSEDYSGNGNRYILARYMGTTAGWSRIDSSIIPAASPDFRMITLKEVQLPSGGTGDYAQAGDGVARIVELHSDGNSYVLFAGTQDGSIVATAVTQPLPTPIDLPMELRDSRLQFRSMWVEGEDLGNFDVYYATDDQFNADGTVANYPWGPKKIINNKVDLGVAAKQIVLKFVHSVASDVTPIISYVNIDYDVWGENN